MAAELRLNVALDIAYFRQELPKLAQAAAGFQLPLKVKFDRDALTDEIRLLSNQLGRRKYSVQLGNSQIKEARTKAENLVRYLNSSFKGKKWFIDIEYRELNAPPSPGGAAAKGGGAAHIAGGYDYIRQQAAKRAGAIDITGEARRTELRGVLERMGTLKEIKAAGKQLGVSGITKFTSKEIPKLIDKIVAEAAIDRIKNVINPQMRMGANQPGVSQSISRLINRMSLVSSDPKAARTAMRGLPPKFITTELAGRASEQAMANIALGQTGAPVSSKFQNSFDKYLQSLVTQSMQEAAAARQRYLARTSPINRLGPATVPPVSGPARVGGVPLLPAVSSAPLSTRQEERRRIAYQRSAERGAAVLGAGGGGGFGTFNRPMLGAGEPERGGNLALIPQTRLDDSYFKNAQRYSTALGVARESLQRLNASNIPLIGGLRNIASEFGEATKQVLLYGTAYKGLAFITGLPGQILEAAKAQQQFANSMQVATQETGTFSKEMLFIDNVQRAFGLNLDTTRQGFMRLYASMAPSGFDSGSIEKLFTGISAATAALQLTPDKAERVIYAFGQMASKGQIMSEELKGQLGDVLPGALAIFADAAGMSVQEFGEKMEDGAFKGQAFRDVLAKVTDELINRFGTGAQAAGKSLQGLLNTLGGEFRRTLESFAPLADSAAQAVLKPMSGALRQLATSGQIAMGEIERVASQLDQARKIVEDVKRSGGSERQLRGAEQNVASLEARYRQLNAALKDPAVEKQVNDIQKFITELSKAGTAVMNMAQAVGNILSPIINALGGNLTTVVTTLTSLYLGFQTARLAAMALMGAMTLLRAVSAALGFGAAAQQAAALAAGLNVLGVSATRATVATVGLRVALTALVASTVVGAVVAGIIAIAGAFSTMRDRANEAAQSSRDAAKAAIDAAYTGNVAMANMQVQQILSQSRAAKSARETLQAVYERATPEQRKGVAPMQLTPQEANALRGTPLTAQIVEGGALRGGKREIRVPSTKEYQAYIRQLGSLAGTQKIALQEAKAAQEEALKVQEATGQNMPTPDTTTTTTEDGEDRNSKLQDYLSQRVGLIRQLGELEKGRISLMADISEEEAKLAEAMADYNTDMAVNMRTKLETEREAAKYAAETRDLFLKEEQERFENEKKLIEQRLALALYGPLVDAQRSQIATNMELVQTLDAVAQGRTQLSAADKMSLMLARHRLALLANEKTATKENIALFDEFAESVLKGAQATDELNKKLSFNQTLLKLRNEAAQLRAPLGQERLVELMQDPNLTPEQAQQQFNLEEQNKRLQVMRQGATDLAGTINSSIGDALTNIATDFQNLQQHGMTFLQTLANGFKQLANTIIQEMTRAMISKAVSQLLGFLMPSIGSFAGGTTIGGSVAMPSSVGIGAGGGIIQNAAGQGFGTLGPNFGIRQFATGGIVTGPTLGLVGEGRFNEAVVPMPNGKSIPVDLGQGAGNNISTNIVVNVNNGQASSQVNGAGGQSLGRELEGAVRSVILKESRPGGIIYNQR